MIDWRIVTFLCFYERNYVAGDCETVRERQYTALGRKERDKTMEKTKRWGILKKRMTKEKYNSRAEQRSESGRMEVRERKREKLNRTGCKTKDIASHLDDERTSSLSKPEMKNS